MKLNNLNKRFYNSTIKNFNNEVHWYPKRIEDLNKIESNILIANLNMSFDSLTFKDKKYRQRREELVLISKSYGIKEQ